MRCILGIEQSCDECRMCIPGVKKQTNADRIRGMTDEELADFLMDVTLGLLLAKRIMNVRKWLQSEVEE